jgi:hypothetical protein
MFAKVKQIKDAELREQQLLKGMELGNQNDQGSPATTGATRH